MDEILTQFREQLIREERSAATVEKYIRSVKRFRAWLGVRELTQEALLSYKGTLIGAASSINGAICSLNVFLRFLQRGDLKLRLVKTQHQSFRNEKRCLTKEEYERLVRTAELQGQKRLARAIETIAASGIRVSELKYVTVECLRRGEIQIMNKGKLRNILLPPSLIRCLKKYCGEEEIRRGPVFVTRSGRNLSRVQLWMEMKKLCRDAKVEQSKVFPHNLRHLFAVVHYRIHKDISKLADILGHSRIDTTRLYLVDSGMEHLRQLEEMHMLCGAQEGSYHLN